MMLPAVRQSGTLIKRYKRFLADIALADNSVLTVHCPNSGSMRGCSTPGSPVIISKSDNPGRKYAWTLEMVHENGVWIGVNTGLTNKIVREALENGTIADFGPITSVHPEITVSDKSRLDFLMQTEIGPVYIEVKNCSLVQGDEALFPDAVTARGTNICVNSSDSKITGYGLLCSSASSVPTDAAFDRPMKLIRSMPEPCMKYVITASRFWPTGQASNRTA